MLIKTDAFPLCIRTQNYYKHICLYIKINDLEITDSTKTISERDRDKIEKNLVTSQFYKSLF